MLAQVEFADATTTRINYRCKHLCRAPLEFFPVLATGVFPVKLRSVKNVADAPSVAATTDSFWQ